MVAKGIVSVFQKTVDTGGKSDLLWFTQQHSNSLNSNVLKNIGMML